MKILHTSDWHLGKYLDKYSRIEEQEKFIAELEEICQRELIDLIIIAGDIYDTTNPPIIAEKLFFDAMKRLSLNGTRPIVVISGNHDSSSRLTSSKPLAYEFGIILQGEPNSIAHVGQYDGFSITKAGEGFFEIQINNEKAVFLTIPYPTEKNLNEIIFYDTDENLQQKSFSDKVRDIFKNLEQNFTNDSINIVVSHLFVSGGIESDSERKIQTIGGTYAISPDVFPKKADYIALGHLHRMQQVKADCLAYYSGSPIRYSQSETGYDKGVIILDMAVGQKPILKKVYLTDYKPIEIFKCDNYEQALLMCQNNSDLNSYVFIEINSDRTLTGQEIQLLRQYKKDIVNIIININGNQQHIYDIQEEKSILEQFKNFYISKNSTQPSDQILDMFLEILNEVEAEDDE